MTLTPADLARIESTLKAWEDAARTGGDYGAAFREAQAVVFDNRDELLTLARRALELESALTYLDQYATIIDPRDEDRVYEPSLCVELAAALGWPGLQSEGGKEQEP